MSYQQNAQTDLLTLLQAQHRLYNVELSSTHQALFKLYKKLARTERVLLERDGNPLSRKDIKRLQWSKSITMKAVEALEWQQNYVHGNLAQCESLIRSYGVHAWNVPLTPWTAMAWMPTTPSAPFSPAVHTPWIVTPTLLRFGQGTEVPQYWDLSSLRERRQSSPYAPSTDSGYHEPALHGRLLHIDEEGLHDPDHVFAHELMSSSTGSRLEGSFVATAQRRQKSSMSEKDNVPESRGLSNKVFVPKHRRRYTDNDSKFEDQGLTPCGGQQRRRSVGPDRRFERCNPDDESPEQRSLDKLASAGFQSD